MEAGPRPNPIALIEDLRADPRPVHGAVMAAPLWLLERARLERAKARWLAVSLLGGDGLVVGYSVYADAPLAAGESLGTFGDWGAAIMRMMTCMGQALDQAGRLDSCAAWRVGPDGKTAGG